MPRAPKASTQKMMKYKKEIIDVISIFGSMDQGLLHNFGIKFPSFVNEKSKRYIGKPELF